MSRFILVDFEDSFTYNIASELLCLPSKKIEEVKVVNFSRFFDQWEFYLKDFQGLIFGPGPGHVDEYAPYFDIIKNILKRKNQSVTGICLGHQILAKVNGAQITKRRRPLHGQRVFFSVPPWEHFFPKSLWGKKVLVQKYNSWCVEQSSLKHLNLSYALDEEGEVAALSSQSFLSYQFHPESVGTSCPEILLEPIQGPLPYNRKSETQVENRWHL